jgi:hypothetical protein
VHAVVTIACAMAVVTLALRRLPRREGAVAALSGLGAFFGAGYLWLFVLWITVPRLEPLFAALPGIYPRATLAMLLYYAPPMLAALGTVRLVARAARRDRMTG